jgi:hypothetical protein
MEKAKNYIINRLNSEDNFASADPYFAFGALIVLGLLSLASLFVKVCKKVKQAVIGRKNRNRKVASDGAQVAHA